MGSSFFSPHSSFCRAALNHLCSWKDLPWPPILSHSHRITLYLPPPEPHSRPISASSIFILRLSIPLSLYLSLSPALSPPRPPPRCVTHIMALIHRLVLRADNGLCHVAKEKVKRRDFYKRERESETQRERESEREMMMTTSLSM